MGLFGLFKKKTQDILETAVELEELEEKAEAELEQEIKNERTFIRKLDWYWYQKNRFLWFRKKYTNVTKKTLNYFRPFVSNVASVWTRLSAAGAAFRGSVDEVNGLAQQIEQINRNLQLTLEKENPKLVNAFKQKKLLLEQRNFIRGYASFVQAEVDTINKEITAIQEESKELQKELEELKRKRAAMSSGAG